jgi:hypothetical protein
MSIVFFTSASLGAAHCVIGIGRPTTTVIFRGPVMRYVQGRAREIRHYNANYKYFKKEEFHHI